MANNRTAGFVFIMMGGMLCPNCDFIEMVLTPVNFVNLWRARAGNLVPMYNIVSSIVLKNRRILVYLKQFQNPV
jgi:hypothetical protein